jgi:hypothetical protein
MHPQCLCTPISDRPFNIYTKIHFLTFPTAIHTYAIGLQEYLDQIIHLIQMSNIPPHKPITQLQFSNVPETLLRGPLDSTLHMPLCTRPA